MARSAIKNEGFFIELFEEFLAEGDALLLIPFPLLDNDSVFHGERFFRCDLRLEVRTESPVVPFAVEGRFRIGWMIKVYREVSTSSDHHALPLPEKVLHVLVAGPVLGGAFGGLAVVWANVIGLLGSGRGHLV